MRTSIAICPDRRPARTAGTRCLTSRRSPRRFGRFGITSGKQVVAYDQDNGMFASRLWWLLALAWPRRRGGARWRSRQVGCRGTPNLRCSTTGAIRRQFQRAAAPRHDRRHRLMSNRARTDPDVASDRRARARAVSRRDRTDGSGRRPYSGRDQPFFPAESRRDAERSRHRRITRASLAAYSTASRPNAPSVIAGRVFRRRQNLLALEHAGMTGAKLYPGSWSEWVSDRARPVGTTTR